MSDVENENASELVTEEQQQLQVEEHTVEEEQSLANVEENTVEENVVEEPVLANVEENVVEEPVLANVEENVEENTVEENVVEEPELENVEENAVEKPELANAEEEEPALANAEENVVEEPEVKFEDIYQPELEPEEIIDVPTPTTPTLVFIVPYRDREAHYKIFSSTMKDTLLSAPPHKILYVNQKDTRGFNRGAMKNIGFLAVKRMYPNDYQNITLVFNDVDTMPAKGTVLNYETTRGVIKHFYGFDYTLGGIVSILASDFERINGFPNFWAWGFEDNLLQFRAKNARIVIDRSVFYKIGDPRITHLVDTPIRTVNSAEFDRFLQKTKEGVDSVKDLDYSVNSETGFIDVLQFNTTEHEALDKRREYDLRNGPAPFKDFVPRNNRRIPTMRMIF